MCLPVVGLDPFIGIAGVASNPGRVDRMCRDYAELGCRQQHRKRLSGSRSPAASGFRYPDCRIGQGVLLKSHRKCCSIDAAGLRSAEAPRPRFPRPLFKPPPGKLATQYERPFGPYSDGPAALRNEQGIFCRRSAGQQLDIFEGVSIRQRLRGARSRKVPEEVDSKPFRPSNGNSLTFESC